jgi:hypothetical protein
LIACEIVRSPGSQRPPGSQNRKLLIFVVSEKCRKYAKAKMASEYDIWKSHSIASEIGTEQVPSVTPIPCDDDRARVSMVQCNASTARDLMDPCDASNGSQNELRTKETQATDTSVRLD